jgi:hypothetical protein
VVQWRQLPKEEGRNHGVGRPGGGGITDILREEQGSVGCEKRMTQIHR